ncbi:hypothetical protein OSB04_021313 [Centaurea solstitialis]|uniref:Reverse transcriptase zinc-binding domain-containing protein n=1 Tax=Centaurea solstitialis TaxID=347529 RepID=A0AA38T622_9ASTR|nr:hypothetical protein OSB04_021313 [Centaurea solstitialis]
MANVDIEVGVGGGETEPTNKKWWSWSKPEPYKSDVEILLMCKDMGEELTKKPSPSINMIRSSDHNVKPKFFHPQVVSIGPLHREDGALKPFEDQKTTHLHHLLGKLKDKPEIILDKCLEKVYASIDRIRECYGETITYTYSDLAKMMVMDACFILDFLFPSEEHRRSTSRNAILTHSIFRDLVLLENQIPFFVLQDIFDCTISKIQTCPLTFGVLMHLKFIIPFDVHGAISVDGPNNYKHILDLVYKCYKPQDASSSDQLSRVTTMFSARELAKAGVKFNPNPDHKWKLDMKFTSSWGNATLTMPPMRIEESTACVLCNLAAYERVFPEVGNYITSYVFAMKMLLDTKEDVLKRVNNQVVGNGSSNLEPAAPPLEVACVEAARVAGGREGGGGTWKNILSINEDMERVNLDLNWFFSKSLRNCANTFFWTNLWCCLESLGARFPRLLALDRNWLCTVADKIKTSAQGVVVFARNGTRLYPLKVIIHSWQVNLDRIPTKANLEKRGVHIDNALCGLCSEALENKEHIFLECIKAKKVWNHLSVWWNRLQDLRTQALIRIGSTNAPGGYSSRVNTMKEVVAQAYLWLI